MKQMSEIEKLRMQIYVLEGQNAFNKEYLAYLHNMISSMESDNEESKPFERRRFPGLYDGLAQVLEFEDDEDYEDDDSLQVALFFCAILGIQLLLGLAVYLPSMANLLEPLPIPNRKVKPVRADGTAYSGRVGSRRPFKSKRRFGESFSSAALLFAQRHF